MRMAGLVPANPRRGRPERGSAARTGDVAAQHDERVASRMTISCVRRLTLTHFRNYRGASLEARGDLVVLVGPNGAGKTNCLEAISFLSPGRGLRRATLEDVGDNQGDGSWAVSAEGEGGLGLPTLVPGMDAAGSEPQATSRRCRIDREPVN